MDDRRSAPAAAPDPAIPPPAAGERGTVWALALATFGLALGVRLLAALTLYRWVDSDQAVLGLMARHILGGERPVLYYGQPYNGALEAYLTAPIVAVWGATDLTIRLVPIVLSALFAALCAAATTRALGRSAGVLAGVFAAIGPPLLLRWTTAAGAGYVEALVLGTAAFVIASGEAWAVARSPRRAAATGLCLGTGLWCDPLILPYAVTLAVVALPALLRGHIRPRACAAAALGGGGLAGLLPVLLVLGPAGLPGLVGVHTGAPTHAAWLGERLTIARRIVTESLPVLVGAAPDTVEATVFRQGVAAHPLPYLAGLALTLSLAARLVRPRSYLWTAARRAFDGQGSLADLLAVLPLVSVAAFLFSRFGALPWAPRDPRYLLPLYTTGAALLVWAGPSWGRPRDPAPQTPGSARVWGWRHGAAGVIVAVVLALNVGALLRDHGPADIAPLTRLLQQHGASVVFADYWVAHRITLASGERVIGVAVLSNLEIGPHRNRNRYEAYLARARSARHVAWVVPLGADEGVLLHRLHASGARWRRAAWGPFAIYTDLTPPLLPPDLVTRGRA